MIPPEELEAGPAILRRWQPGWSTELLTAVLASLPELQAHMVWAKDGYDSDSAETFLRETARGWVEGTDFGYAIWTPGGAIVGSASLMGKMGPGVLEIGYWVRTAYTGRGLATAAAIALALSALSMPGVSTVAIRHDAANLASARVAHRAGFVEVQRRPSTLDEGREGTGVEVLWERRRT